VKRPLSNFHSGPGEEVIASAIFQFRGIGDSFRLKNIYLVTETEGDEAPLKRATGRLLSPCFVEEIKRLFKRPQFD
jgi:hypothetical protein